MITHRDGSRAAEYSSKTLRVAWTGTAVLAGIGGAFGCAALLLLPNFRESNASQTGAVGESFFASLIAISLDLPFLALSAWLAIERVRLSRVAVGGAVAAMSPGVVALVLYLKGPPGAI